MDTDCKFYLCTTCFRTSEKQQTCHGELMICYDRCDVDKRKPPIDENGRILTRAPIWFLEGEASRRDPKQSDF